MTSGPIEEIAPAKLNLFLHVTGKRLSGMHELESLVVFTELADRVSVEPGKRLTLKVVGPCAEELADMSTPADNLVIKAGKALQLECGVKEGAKILLEKNLPVAAGIGGGSSDAAAAMKALTHLWSQVLPLNKVKKVARSLGADVPVCLTRQSAVVRGVGDRLSIPPQIPSMHVVLVNPGFYLSTKDVFQNLNWRVAIRQKKVPFPTNFENEAHFVRFLKSCRNDLEDSAVEFVPEIDVVLDALEAQWGCKFARMSGSGATCYGLFSSEKNAVRAQQALEKHAPNWWISRTKF